jgi:arsenate reductase
VTTNVLILCTHNSTRSVLAEGMLDHWAAKLGKDVRAYSAGSAPNARINSYALAALAGVGIETGAFRSKTRDEFTAADAPTMDVIITVGDSAAAETCPYWPGSPVTVHWGYPDPSNAPESQMRQAFDLTRQAIGYRMLQLLALPLPTMSASKLQEALTAIAKD